MERASLPPHDDTELSQLTPQEATDIALWEAEMAAGPEITEESGSSETVTDNEVIVEVADTDEAAFEELALQEEAPYRAPDFLPGSELSEAEYNMLLTERLSGAGRTLDTVKDRVETDEQAREWLELKMVVAATKTIADMGDKVEAIIELEWAVYDFAGTFGVDYVFN